MDENLDDLENMKANLFNFKPSDCEYCKVISVGVFGAHYSCFNKKCKWHYQSPIMGCNKDECEHYKEKDK